MTQELHEAADWFTEKVTRFMIGTTKSDREANAEVLNRWLKEEFTSQIQLKPLPNDATLAKCMRELKDLKKHVVFLPVDKARHDCAVMCEAYYCELLKNEMESYEQVENVLTDGLMKTKRNSNFQKSLAQCRTYMRFLNCIRSQTSALDGLQVLLSTVKL